VGIILLECGLGGGVVSAADCPECKCISPQEGVEVGIATQLLGAFEHLLNFDDAAGPDIDGIARHGLAEEKRASHGFEDGERREPIEREAPAVLGGNDLEGCGEVAACAGDGVIGLLPDGLGCGESFAEDLFAAAHCEVHGGRCSRDQCDDQQDARGDERGLAAEEERGAACATRVSPFDRSRGEPCVEILGDGVSGGVSIGRTRRKGAAADGIKIGVDFRAEGAGRGRRAIGMVVAGGDLGGVLAVWGLADEKEIQKPAQGVDIRGDGLRAVIAAELLGCGEGQVANGGGIGDAPGIGADCRGDAEVCDFGNSVLGEQDVGRLEVAVNNASKVGGVHATADLRDKLRGLAGGQRFGAFGEPLGQIAIVDVLVEDVVHARIVGGAIEDAYDVGVADTAGLACLGRGLRCGIDVEHGPHALDGDPCGAIGFGKLTIGGEVDLALCADTKSLTDIEPASTIGHARTEVAWHLQRHRATGGAGESGG